MKSKRSKACEILKKTRMTVEIRDNGMCIICGGPGISNAHYIPRSQGGMGIEQNIVTLCLKCHHDYDNGFKHLEYKELIKNYLENKYFGWNEEKLIYKKY